MTQKKTNTAKPAPRHRKAKATPNHRDIMNTKYDRQFQSVKGGRVREHTFAEAAAYFADQLTFATGAPYLQQTALADVFQFNIALRSMYSSNNEYSAAFWKLTCNDQILQRFGGDDPDIAKRRAQAMAEMSKGMHLAAQGAHFRKFLSENADKARPCTAVTASGLLKPYNAWVCAQDWTEEEKSGRVAITDNKRKALIEDVANGQTVAQAILPQTKKGGGKTKLDTAQMVAAIEKLFTEQKANKKTRAAVMQALAKSAGVQVEIVKKGSVSMPKLKSEIALAS